MWPLPSHGPFQQKRKIDWIVIGLHALVERRRTHFRVAEASGFGRFPRGWADDHRQAAGRVLSSEGDHVGRFDSGNRLWLFSFAVLGLLASGEGLLK